MQETLSNLILKICLLFKHEKVEYIIVGGTAVALHGYYRHSVTLSGEITDKPDLDIWFNPTYENYFRILNVIESLGINISEYRNEETINPKTSFLKLEFDDFTLDFLPSIKAEIAFNNAYKNKECVVVNDVEIFFLSFNDLVKDKQISARKKDIEDLKHLDKLNNTKLRKKSL